MVDGFAMNAHAAAPSVAFVDLDGTLVLENSYHAFVVALWSHGSAAARRAIVGAAIGRALVAPDGRRLMKERVIEAFRTQRQAARDDVVAEVVQRMQRV